MSRIVSGDSPDVKTVQAVQAVARQAKDLAVVQFRSIRASDTLSIEESDIKAREAAQKAKQLASQEVEQRLRQPVQAALTNLENILDEVSKFRGELFKEAESEVLDLVQRICRKVLASELKTDPTKLNEIISRGIEVLEKEKVVKVVLNPQDMQMFLKNKPDFDQKFSGRAEIEVGADASVSAGTALLQTMTREIDVNVEKMADEILGVMKEKISEIKETGDEGDKV